MIAAHLTVPEVVEAYREMLGAAAFPYLLIANAVEPEAAAGLRAALDAAGTERFWIADRGRYHHNDTLQIPPLWEQLVGFAAGITGRPLAVHRARWLRLGRGDYGLVKDDGHTRPPGRHVELTVDLSAGFHPDGECVYADGAGGVGVPALPGLLVVVDRSPTSTRYDRPLTVRSGDGAEIVRLRMWLIAPQP